MSTTTDYLSSTGPYNAPAPRAQEDLGDLDDLLPDDDSDADEVTPGTAHSAGARAKAGPNKGLIRRVANKAAELQGAPKPRKETLASMLGCTTELAELTFAVMASDRSALAPATDLTSIAEEDVFGAALAATALGRNRMKGVWALLTTLGAELPVTIPPSEAKAGIALARACSKLPAATTDELAKVVALARKS